MRKVVVWFCGWIAAIRYQHLLKYFGLPRRQKQSTFAITVWNDPLLALGQQIRQLIPIAVSAHEELMTTLTFGYSRQEWSDQLYAYCWQRLEILESHKIVEQLSSNNLSQLTDQLVTWLEEDKALEINTYLVWEDYLLIHDPYYALLEAIRAYNHGLNKASTNGA